MTKETKIMNLTPHAVSVAGVTFKPSGLLVRAKEDAYPAGSIEGLPVVYLEFGAPEVPEEALEHLKNGGYVIVSSIAAKAMLEHMPQYARQIFVPALPVRDEQGRIIGSKALATYVKP